MVDYEYYVNQYMGSAIPEKSFAGMAARARDALSALQRRFRVVSDGEESLKMAMCAMAEVLYSWEKCRDGLTGATVGETTVHYDRSGRSLSRELYESAGIYLELHRGVGK